MPPSRTSSLAIIVHKLSQFSEFSKSQKSGHATWSWSHQPQGRACAAAPAHSETLGRTPYYLYVFFVHGIRVRRGKSAAAAAVERPCMPALRRVTSAALASGTRRWHSATLRLLGDVLVLSSLCPCVCEWRRDVRRRRRGGWEPVARGGVGGGTQGVGSIAVVIGALCQ